MLGAAGVSFGRTATRPGPLEPTPGNRLIRRGVGKKGGADDRGFLTDAVHRVGGSKALVLNWFTEAPLNGSPRFLGLEAPKPYFSISRISDQGIQRFEPVEVPLPFHIHAVSPPLTELSKELGRPGTWSHFARRSRLQLGRHSSQPRRHLDLRCALRAADGRLKEACHVH